MQLNAAAGRLLEAGNQAQTGSLARSRRPEHGEELAVVDIQADIIDCAHLTEVAADVAEPNCWDATFCHNRFLTSP
jgi:hypothetical protein